MTESDPVRPRYLEAAAAHLERAVAADDAREAIRVLELVGRELVAPGGPRTLVVGGRAAGLGRARGSGVDDGGGSAAKVDVVTLPDGLVALLAEHPGLVARAARSLGMFAEMDGAEAFPEMLYARSGYQALVDARVWPTHPVRIEHLEESDEEIIDAVAEVGVPDADIPAGVPPGHPWWPRRRAGRHA